MHISGDSLSSNIKPTSGVPAFVPGRARSIRFIKPVLKGIRPQTSVATNQNKRVDQKPTSAKGPGKTPQKPPPPRASISPQIRINSLKKKIEETKRTAVEASQYVEQLKAELAHCSDDERRLSDKHKRLKSEIALLSSEIQDTPRRQERQQKWIKGLEIAQGEIGKFSQELASLKKQYTEGFFKIQTDSLLSRAYLQSDSQKEPHFASTDQNVLNIALISKTTQQVLEKKTFHCAREVLSLNQFLSSIADRSDLFVVMVGDRLSPDRSTCDKLAAWPIKKIADCQGNHSWLLIAKGKEVLFETSHSYADAPSIQVLLDTSTAEVWRCNSQDLINKVLDLGSKRRELINQVYWKTGKGLEKCPWGQASVSIYSLLSGWAPHLDDVYEKLVPLDLTSTRAKMWITAGGFSKKDEIKLWTQSTFTLMDNRNKSYCGVTVFELDPTQLDSYGKPYLCRECELSQWEGPKAGKLTIMISCGEGWIKENEQKKIAQLGSNVSGPVGIDPWLLVMHGKIIQEWACISKGLIFRFSLTELLGFGFQSFNGPQSIENFSFQSLAGAPSDAIVEIAIAASYSRRDQTKILIHNAIQNRKLVYEWTSCLTVVTFDPDSCKVISEKVFVVKRMPPGDKSIASYLKSLVDKDNMAIVSTGIAELSVEQKKEISEICGSKAINEPNYGKHYLFVKQGGQIVCDQTGRENQRISYFYSPDPSYESRFFYEATQKLREGIAQDEANLKKKQYYLAQLKDEAEKILCDINSKLDSQPKQQKHLEDQLTELKKGLEAKENATRKLKARLSQASTYQISLKEDLADYEKQLQQAQSQKKPAAEPSISQKTPHLPTVRGSAISTSSDEMRLKNHKEQLEEITRTQKFMQLWQLSTLLSENLSLEGFANPIPGSAVDGYLAALCYLLQAEPHPHLANSPNTPLPEHLVKHLPSIKKRAQLEGYNAELSETQRQALFQAFCEEFKDDPKAQEHLNLEPLVKPVLSSRQPGEYALYRPIKKEHLAKKIVELLELSPAVMEDVARTCVAGHLQRELQNVNFKDIDSCCKNEELWCKKLTSFSAHEEFLADLLGSKFAAGDMFWPLKALNLLAELSANDEKLLKKWQEGFLFALKLLPQAIADERQEKKLAKEGEEHNDRELLSKLNQEVTALEAQAQEEKQIYAELQAQRHNLEAEEKLLAEKVLQLNEAFKKCQKDIASKQEALKKTLEAQSTNSAKRDQLSADLKALEQKLADISAEQKLLYQSQYEQQKLRSSADEKVKLFNARKERIDAQIKDVQQRKDTLTLWFTFLEELEKQLLTPSYFSQHQTLLAQISPLAPSQIYQTLTSRPEFSHLRSAELDKACAKERFDEIATKQELCHKLEMLTKPAQLEFSQDKVTVSGYYLDWDKEYTKLKNSLSDMLQAQGLQLTGGVLKINNSTFVASRLDSKLRELIHRHIEIKKQHRVVKDRPVWEAVWGAKSKADLEIDSLHIPEHEVFAAYFKEIEFIATDYLRLKEDINLPGVSLLLHSAGDIDLKPGIKINTCLVDSENRPITAAVKFIHKAHDGAKYRKDPSIAEGRDGDDGLDGFAGNCAGFVDLYAKGKIGNLQAAIIQAVGQDGMDGQVAGNGDAGREGQDGKDAECDDTEALRMEPIVYVAKALPAVLPGDGGNGGAGGLGAGSGLGGNIRMQDKDWLIFKRPSHALQLEYSGKEQLDLDSLKRVFDDNLRTADGRQGVDQRPGSGGSGAPGVRQGADQWGIAEAMRATNWYKGKVKDEFWERCKKIKPRNIDYGKSEKKLLPMVTDMFWYDLKFNMHKGTSKYAMQFKGHGVEGRRFIELNSEDFNRIRTNSKGLGGDDGQQKSSAQRKKHSAVEISVNQETRDHCKQRADDLLRERETHWQQYTSQKSQALVSLDKQHLERLNELHDQQAALINERETLNGASIQLAETAQKISESTNQANFLRSSSLKALDQQAESGFLENIKRRGTLASDVIDLQSEQEQSSLTFNELHQRQSEIEQQRLQIISLEKQLASQQTLQQLQIKKSALSALQNRQQRLEQSQGDDAIQSNVQQQHKEVVQSEIINIQSQSQVYSSQPSCSTAQEELKGLLGDSATTPEISKEDFYELISEYSPTETPILERKASPNTLIETIASMHDILTQRDPKLAAAMWEKVYHLIERHPNLSPEELKKSLYLIADLIDTPNIDSQSKKHLQAIAQQVQNRGEKQLLKMCAKEPGSNLHETLRSSLQARIASEQLTAAERLRCTGACLKSFYELLQRDKSDSTVKKAKLLEWIATCSAYPYERPQNSLAEWKKLAPWLPDSSQKEWTAQDHEAIYEQLVLTILGLNKEELMKFCRSIVLTYMPALQEVVGMRLQEMLFNELPRDSAENFIIALRSIYEDYSQSCNPNELLDMFSNHLCKNKQSNDFWEQIDALLSSDPKDAALRNFLAKAQQRAYGKALAPTWKTMDQLISAPAHYAYRVEWLQLEKQLAELIQGEFNRFAKGRLRPLINYTDLLKAVNPAIKAMRLRSPAEISTALATASRDLRTLAETGQSIQLAQLKKILQERSKEVPEGSIALIECALQSVDQQLQKGAALSSSEEELLGHSLDCLIALSSNPQTEVVFTRCEELCFNLSDKLPLVWKKRLQQAYDALNHQHLRLIESGFEALSQRLQEDSQQHLACIKRQFPSKKKPHGIDAGLQVLEDFRRQRAEDLLWMLVFYTTKSGHTLTEKDELWATWERGSQTMEDWISQLEGKLNHLLLSLESEAENLQSTLAAIGFQEDLPLSNFADQQAKALRRKQLRQHPAMLPLQQTKSATLQGLNQFLETTTILGAATERKELLECLTNSLRTLNTTVPTYVSLDSLFQQLPQQVQQKLAQILPSSHLPSKSAQLCHLFNALPPETAPSTELLLAIKQCQLLLASLSSEEIVEVKLGDSVLTKFLPLWKAKERLTPSIAQELDALAKCLGNLSQHKLQAFYSTLPKLEDGVTEFTQLKLQLERHNALQPLLQFLSSPVDLELNPNWQTAVALACALPTLKRLDDDHKYKEIRRKLHQHALAELALYGISCHPDQPFPLASLLDPQAANGKIKAKLLPLLLPKQIEPAELSEIGDFLKHSLSHDKLGLAQGLIRITLEQKILPQLASPLKNATSADLEKKRGLQREWLKRALNYVLNLRSATELQEFLPTLETAVQAALKDQPIGKQILETLRFQQTPDMQKEKLLNLLQPEEKNLALYLDTATLNSCLSHTPFAWLYHLQKSYFEKLTKNASAPNSTETLDQQQKLSLSYHHAILRGEGAAWLKLAEELFWQPTATETPAISLKELNEIFEYLPFCPNLNHLSEITAAAQPIERADWLKFNMAAALLEELVDSTTATQLQKLKQLFKSSYDSTQAPMRGQFLTLLLQNLVYHKENQAIPLSEKELNELFKRLIKTGAAADPATLAVLKATAVAGEMPVALWNYALQREQKRQEIESGLLPDGRTEQLKCVADLLTIKKKQGAEKADRLLKLCNETIHSSPPLTPTCFQKLLSRFASQYWILDDEAMKIIKKDPNGCLALLKDYYEKKANDKNKNLTIEELIAAIDEEPGDINKPLKEHLLRERSTVIQRLQNIHQRYESKYQQWNKDQISQWSKEKKDQGQALSGEEQLDECLAVMMRAVELSNNHKPRDAQLLALLAFGDSLIHPNKTKGRLANISTGQGKTLISALLATLHILNGAKRVDIATSSLVLAESNAQETKNLFAHFGINATTLCDAVARQNPEERQKRYANNEVFYADVATYKGDLLPNGPSLTSLRTQEQKAEVLILDEVDHLLLDHPQDTLYPQHRIEEFSDLKDLYIAIWKEVTNTSHQPSKENIAALSAKIRAEIESGKLVLPKSMKTFTERRLKTWIKCAFDAKHLKRGEHYDLEINSKTKLEEIVIMDISTGVEQLNTQWQNGLQQFLQLKHNHKLTDESLQAVFMSNLTFFEGYTQLYGMSGTLGQKAERAVLRKEYGVDYFKCPDYCASYVVEEPGEVMASEEAWLEAITKDVEAKVGTSEEDLQSRSVLLICETKRQVALLENYLKKRFPEKESAKKIHTYDSLNRPLPERLEEDGLPPGEIIIATNIAGRGTDIKTTRALNKNGGLHVLLTYVTSNSRIQRQAYGRTGRSGNKGSCKSIVKDERANYLPHITLDFLREESELQESQRLRRIQTELIPTVRLKERYLQQFMQLQKEVLAQLQKIKMFNLDNYLAIQQSALKSRWAMWLDENARHFNKQHKDSAKLIESFDSFKKQIRQQLQDSSFYKLVQTPADLIKLGIYYLSDDNYNAAESCFDKIIADDPALSGFAYYYQAFCTIHRTGKNPQEKAQARASLKKAFELLEKSNERLYARNQSMAILNKHLKEAGQGGAANQFSVANNDEIRVISAHEDAIFTAIGTPLKSDSFKSGTVVEEESQEIFEKMRQNFNHQLIKDFRISKKTSIGWEIALHDSAGKIAALPEEFAELKQELKNCQQATLKLSSLSSEAQAALRSAGFIFSRELYFVDHKIAFPHQYQAFKEQFINDIDEKLTQKVNRDLSPSYFNSWVISTTDFLQKAGRFFIAKDTPMIALQWDSLYKQPATFWQGSVFQDRGLKIEEVLKKLPALSERFLLSQADLDDAIAQAIGPPALTADSYQAILQELETHKIILRGLKTGDSLIERHEDYEKHILGKWEGPAFQDANGQERGAEIKRLVQSLDLSKTPLSETEFKKVVIDKIGPLTDSKWQQLLEKLKSDEILILTPVCVLNLSTQKKLHSFFTSLEFAEKPSQQSQEEFFDEKCRLIDQLQFLGWPSKRAEQEALRSQLKEVLREQKPLQKKEFKLGNKCLSKEHFQLLILTLNSSEGLLKTSLSSLLATYELDFSIPQQSTVIDALLEIYHAGGLLPQGQLPFIEDKKKAAEELFQQLEKQKVLKQVAVLFTSKQGEDPKGRKREIKDILDENLSQLIDLEPKVKALVTKEKVDKEVQRLNSELNSSQNRYIKSRPSDEKLRAQAQQNVEEQARNKLKEEYVDSLKQTLLQAAGFIKTTKQIKIGQKSLSDVFIDSDKYPTEAIDDYLRKGLGKVLSVEKYQSKMHWQAFWAGMIGLGQLLAGAFLLSCGVESLGRALISEGIGDMIYATQAGLNGTFNWKNYWKYKKESLAITFATMMLGGVSTGFNLAKQAATTSAKLVLLRAISKIVVAQIIERVISFGLDTLMEKLAEIVTQAVFEKLNRSIQDWISKDSNYQAAQKRTLLAVENLYKSFGQEEADRIIQGAIVRTLSNVSSDHKAFHFVNQAVNILGGRCSRQLGQYASKTDKLNEGGVASKYKRYKKIAAGVVSLINYSITIIKISQTGTTFMNNLEQELSQALKIHKATRQSKELSSKEKQSCHDWEGKFHDKIIDLIKGYTSQEIVARGFKQVVDLGMNKFAKKMHEKAGREFYNLQEIYQTFPQLDQNFIGNAAEEHKQKILAKVAQLPAGFKSPLKAILENFDPQQIVSHSHGVAPLGQLLDLYHAPGEHQGSYLLQTKQGLRYISPPFEKAVKSLTHGRTPNLSEIAILTQQAKIPIIEGSVNESGDYRYCNETLQCCVKKGQTQGLLLLTGDSSGSYRVVPWEWNEQNDNIQIMDKFVDVNGPDTFFKGITFVTARRNGITEKSAKEYANSKDLLKSTKAYAVNMLLTNSEAKELFNNKRQENQLAFMAARAAAVPERATNDRHMHIKSLLEQPQRSAVRRATKRAKPRTDFASYDPTADHVAKPSTEASPDLLLDGYYIQNQLENLGLNKDATSEDVEVEIQSVQERMEQNNRSSSKNQEKTDKLLAQDSDRLIQLRNIQQQLKTGSMERNLASPTALMAARAAFAMINPASMQPGSAKALRTRIDQLNQETASLNTAIVEETQGAPSFYGEEIRERLFSQFLRRQAKRARTNRYHQQLGGKPIAPQPETRDKRNFIRQHADKITGYAEGSHLLVEKGYNSNFIDLETEPSREQVSTNAADIFYSLQGSNFEGDLTVDGIKSHLTDLNQQIELLRDSEEAAQEIVKLKKQKQNFEKILDKLEGKIREKAKKAKDALGIEREKEAVEYYALPHFWEKDWGEYQGLSSLSEAQKFIDKQINDIDKDLKSKLSEDLESKLSELKDLNEEIEIFKTELEAYEGSKEYVALTRKELRSKIDSIDQQLKQESNENNIEELRKQREALNTRLCLKGSRQIGDDDLTRASILAYQRSSKQKFLCFGDEHETRASWGFDEFMRANENINYLREGLSTSECVGLEDGSEAYQLASAFIRWDFKKKERSSENWVEVFEKPLLLQRLRENNVSEDSITEFKKHVFNQPNPDYFDKLQKVREQNIVSKLKNPDSEKLNIIKIGLDHVVPLHKRHSDNSRSLVDESGAAISAIPLRGGYDSEIEDYVTQPNKFSKAIGEDPSTLNDQVSKKLLRDLKYLQGVPAKKI